MASRAALLRYLLAFVRHSRPFTLSVARSCRYAFQRGLTMWRDGFRSHRAGIYPALALAPLVPLAPHGGGKGQEQWRKALEAVMKDDSLRLKRILPQLEVAGLGIDEQHALGWTLLHVAAINGSRRCMRILVDGGADVNAADEYEGPYRREGRWLIPDREVRRQREEEFSDKIKSHVGFKGFTALHYAVLSDDMSSVKVLLEAGANPSARTHHGYRPSDLADRRDMKQLLEEAIPKYEEVKEKRQRAFRRLHPLEEHLRKSLVGQDGAINVVGAAIRRKQNGWQDTDHPLVFLFLGSSGIGKTELAKQVASYLYKGKKEAFIRMDMSEYQEKHEVAKFIGAPPGYIGYEKGGQLTSQLSKFPNAVVLFDEVEKAHPDVLTALLQLFDEGRLTDGQGKTVECKDAIFIMTSNMAADEIRSHGLELRKEARRHRQRQASQGDVREQITVSREFKDRVVQPILKRHLKRDEFLGRINEIVYFLPFSSEELCTLARRELEIWAKRAAQRHKIKLNWDLNLPSVIAHGYDAHYGARSIKYEVDRRVVDLLASADERGFLSPGCEVHVEVVGEGKTSRPSEDVATKTDRLQLLRLHIKKPEKDSKSRDIYYDGQL